MVASAIPTITVPVAAETQQPPPTNTNDNDITKKAQKIINVILKLNAQ